jgi:hypothetical protein
MLQEAKILIFDEVGMTEKFHLEAIDRSLKLLCKTDKPFGGKTVVFSGDFRQILPVVKRGNRAEIMSKIVKKAIFWEQVITLKLKENNRVNKFIASDPDNQRHYIEHAEFLLRVGNGTESEFPHAELAPGCIKVPENYLLDKEKEGSIEELLRFVFPEIFSGISSGVVELDHERAILCPINKVSHVSCFMYSLFSISKFFLLKDVDEVNEAALKFLTEFNHTLAIETYASADSAVAGSKDTLASFLPTEFINTLTPSGMPSHILKVFSG